jgi:GNAT superfamily N-acetyltransferase
VTDLDLEHYDGQHATAIRDLLLDIHTEVYTDSGDPLAPPEAFAPFLDHWITRPGFACTLARRDSEPVGYAYGAPLGTDTTWWQDITPAPDPAFTTETGQRTFALSELMVRTPWRGTGAARLIHDRLLAHRPEERVTLLTHQTHPKVVAVYRDWGYQIVGEMTPKFPDAPPLYAMMRPLPLLGS